MRKADYAALADSIGHVIAQATPPEGSRPLAHHLEVCRIQKSTAERIARDFASHASVNRSEFLKACGIEP